LKEEEFLNFKKLGYTIVSNCINNEKSGLFCPGVYVINAKISKRKQYCLTTFLITG
jgi:hypothetical protein